MQTTTKGHRLHQGDMPPLLIPVTVIEKCKQANEFQSQQYGHLIINYSSGELARFAIQGCLTLEQVNIKKHGITSDTPTKHHGRQFHTFARLASANLRCTELSPTCFPFPVISNVIHKQGSLH